MKSSVQDRNLVIDLMGKNMNYEIVQSLAKSCGGAFFYLISISWRITIIKSIKHLKSNITISLLLILIKPIIYLLYVKS